MSGATDGAVRHRAWIGEGPWIRPLKSAAVVYGCLAIVAVFFADRLIFVPPPSSYGEAHPALHLIGAEDQDRPQVAAFWYPPPNDTAPVLLWTHGNAEDLGTLEPILELFSSQQIGVLGIDYPGYGLSSGLPSEADCYEAIESGLRFLVDDRKIAIERVVVVGQSVGSGPATWLAERYPEIRGLVLISPFLSAFRAVTRVPLFPADRFPNLRRIRKVTCPLLVIHGEQDEVIPFNQGQRIHAAHPGEQKDFLALPGTGHNDLWARNVDEVLGAIIDFTFFQHPPGRETEP